MVHGVMRHTKPNSVYHRFCHGIMVFILIVCPFFTIKAQDIAEPNTQDTSRSQNKDQEQRDSESDIQDTSKSENKDQEQSDTKSNTQETSKSQNKDQEQGDTKSNTQDTLNDQNNNKAPLSKQDFLILLNKQDKNFADQTTKIMVVFIPLLIILLIYLIWTFFRYRTLAQKLNDVRNGIDHIAKANSEIKQDLSAVNRRIQPPVNAFDTEELYKALTLNSQMNTQEILKQIRTLTPNSTISTGTALTEKKETTETHETTIVDEHISQEIVEFCACYNAAIIDRQEWSNFVSKYKQNFKIDVVNAEERFLNQKIDIEPIFKTNSAGCFLALYIEAEKLYAIVPVYDLVIERSTYFTGAFGEVFECSQFDSQSNYRISELIQPAIFEPDDAKETWIRKEKGILELQEV